MRIEQAPRNDESVISYFEKDGIRNVLNIWNLEREENGFELHVCRIGDEAKGHISMYTTPEAVYGDLGGEPSAAKSLLPLVPSKAILITTNEIGEIVTEKLKFDNIFKNDIMIVKRVEEGYGVQILPYGFRENMIPSIPNSIRASMCQRFHLTGSASDWTTTLSMEFSRKMSLLQWPV